MKLFLFFLIFNLLGCINENKDLNNAHIDKLREEALQDWEDIYANITYHGSALRKMKRIIKSSSSNQDELVEISEMISELSFHTDVLLSIAKANAKKILSFIVIEAGLTIEKNIKETKSIIFDLDGTLWNPTNVIVKAWYIALKDIEIIKKL